MISLGFVHKLARLVIIGGVVSTLAGTTHAAITFDYIFSGSFLTDPNAIQEQNAIKAAGQLYSNQFANYFSNTGNIVLTVDGYNDPSSGVLASAGSNLVLGPTTPGLINEVILDKLQKGFDGNGAAADGGVSVNFAFAYDLDPNPATLQPGQFDLFSILNHEFTHALGFNNLINIEGSGIGGQFSTWDTHLSDSLGRLILNSDFTLNQTAFALAKSTGFYFEGAASKAANGGLLVALASTGGTDSLDVSHLSDIVFPDDLMVPARGAFPDPETRLFSAVDIGIFRDLGYTPFATAVPEPGSIILVGAGLPFALVVLSRRRKAIAA